MRNIRYSSVLITILALTGLAVPAEAWTEHVIHDFQFDALGSPMARLLLLDGKLYGTTNGNGGPGQIFSLTHSKDFVWNPTTIYFFNPKSTQRPLGGLILLPKGRLGESGAALLGTTSVGSGTSANGGSVFALELTSNNLVTLYTFPTEKNDGVLPSSDLLLADADSTLYGITLMGGHNDWGTVYAVHFNKTFPWWTNETIFRFPGGTNGGWPQGGLVEKASGVLYGSTML